MGARLSVEQRRGVRRLFAQGLGGKEVARQAGCSLRTVWTVVAGPSHRETLTSWSPGGSRLTLAEREEISVALARGDSFTSIGRQLGRAIDDLVRSPRTAAVRLSASGMIRFPSPAGPAPQAHCPRLFAQVKDWLEELWSPQEIASRLLIGSRTIDDAGEPRNDLPQRLRARPW
jgi:DNA-binding CsgD family transcriptional regulator